VSDDELFIREDFLLEELDLAIQQLIDASRPFWNRFDGQGGFIYAKLFQAILQEEFPTSVDSLLNASEFIGMARRDERKVYVKTKIPNSLRKQVYERDSYRCVKCGSWKDLSLDHSIPESKGGETSLQNLKTMCMVCNRKKGVSHED